MGALDCTGSISVASTALFTLLPSLLIWAQHCSSNVSVASTALFTLLAALLSCATTFHLRHDFVWHVFPFGVALATMPCLYNLGHAEDSQHL